MKTTAANGVWNNPANPQIIPNFTKNCFFSILKSSGAIFPPIAPPNCTATPSRPTLTPKLCANKVFKVKINGNFHVTFSFLSVAASIKYFIPIALVCKYLLLNLVKTSIKGVRINKYL